MGSINYLRVIVGALVGAVALGTSLLLTPTSHAEAPGCVSEHEYYAVSVGMRMARIHDVFGTSGRRMWRDGNIQRRAYNICRVGEGVYARYVLVGGGWYMLSKRANAG